MALFVSPRWLVAEKGDELGQHLGHAVCLDAQMLG